MSNLQNLKKKEIRGFECCKDPIKQLYIVHTFVRNEDGTSMKLVPLCFILMTTRKTQDYVEVSFTN